MSINPKKHAEIITRKPLMLYSVAIEKKIARKLNKIRCVVEQLSCIREFSGRIFISPEEHVAFY